MAAPQVPQIPRIISFEQLCIEADPDWVTDSYQPPEIYVFSNGRTFDHEIPFYPTGS